MPVFLDARISFLLIAQLRAKVGLDFLDEQNRVPVDVSAIIDPHVNEDIAFVEMAGCDKIVNCPVGIGAALGQFRIGNQYLAVVIAAFLHVSLVSRHSVIIFKERINVCPRGRITSGNEMLRVLPLKLLLFLERDRLLLIFNQPWRHLHDMTPDILAADRFHPVAGLLIKPLVDAGPLYLGLLDARHFRYDGLPLRRTGGALLRAPQVTRKLRMELKVLGIERAGNERRVFRPFRADAHLLETHLLKRVSV